MPVSQQKSMERPHILFVLPNRFASRNILESEIPKIMAEQQVRVTFVSLLPEDEEKVASLGCADFQWNHLKRPACDNKEASVDLVLIIKNLVYRLVHLLLFKRASHEALFYRFHKIHNLFIHRWWSMRSLGRWSKGSGVQRKLVDRRLAWPWPMSSSLLSQLKKLRFWNWGSDYRVERFMTAQNFNVVVFNFVQTSPIFPYVMATRRRNIPTIGIVGSWDNPTTKGPLYPCDRYVVQNSYMADKLEKLHGIDRQQQVITGWPQMDIYRKKEVIVPRQKFLSSLGLEPDCKLILFGTSTKRFGAHEPDVIRHMIDRAEAGTYGAKIGFVFRAHPGDRIWQQRLGPFMDRSNVVIEPPNYHDRDHLVNLLKHADIVISTAGTISLDAVAFDTCTINLVFDGDLAPSDEKKVARFYESEHYASILQSAGTRPVYSYDELDQAICTYLENPTMDHEGRHRLHQEHLQPFDGQASARLAKIILETAEGVR